MKIEKTVSNDAATTLFTTDEIATLLARIYIRMAEQKLNKQREIQHDV